MAEIRGIPDESRKITGAPILFAGREWFLSTIDGWSKTQAASERYHSLNLTDLEFVTLFEWTSTVALIDRVLGGLPTGSFSLDFLGGPEFPILSSHDFIELSNAEDTDKTREDFIQAERVYRVAGFLESLRTSEALNIDKRGSQVIYPWLGIQQARLRSIYSRRQGNEETIVMPLIRISSKDDCRQFLDEQRIINWREAMDVRFRDSPLFEYEELWRVFCHELAVNAYEHAKSAGFLTGRVVLPYKDSGEILNWCEQSYQPEIVDLFPKMKSGFLELCVCDSGDGFLESLGPAFRRQANIQEDTEIKNEDLLAFAFDELGTSKLESESWVTSKHALGRILQIVAKYGGSLTLRSEDAEVVYVSTGGPFDRIPGHLGYKPQKVRQLPNSVSGSHFQLILPLIPFQKAAVERESILISTLPEGFHADPTQVRGHLVPLLEKLGTGEPAVGKEELQKFRKRCEQIARNLINFRPSGETLVLDFSGLIWTAAQFETLMYLLQNVLQQRPVLLVEILPDLAHEVVDLEMDVTAPTLLDEEIFSGELSEQKFLETYRGLHSTVLGVDLDSREYIFGLYDRRFESILLGLIDKPKSVADICANSDVESRELRAVFHNMNPLFQCDSSGRWSTAWDRMALATETKRAMSRWFDDVAERCEAWWSSTSPELEKAKFNLPWEDEWVTDFFEAARILSRQRHADEAAQRLIFRLEAGLKPGKTLLDVGVLACVTAPSILLATAMHRWWPNANRPAIADLGPYLLLHDEGLPVMADSGSIVVIQDVLDRKLISSRLVKRLERQGKNVLCILSLSQLVDADDEKHPIGATNVDSWDTDIVRSHAMINLERPAKTAPATDEDQAAYWVEPRTLRPFNYNLLRRKRKARVVPEELERPDFFESKQEGLLCAGHYVYGERHYTIALDIKRALDGVIGDEVSNWVANICAGKKAKKTEWESERSGEFAGEVTAVLMPLHSQIHYLWPSIENRLAASGRRVLMWLLDATLFLGQGAAYRLPLQLQDQIDRSMESILQSDASQNNSIRLLILDDGMVRARTAETIIAEIDRAVHKAREKMRPTFKEKVDSVDPINWIRYFAVFDQMGHARRQHWRNLSTVGHGRGIPFLFEEYKWITGVPDYEMANCPACAEFDRAQQLASAANHIQADDVRDWAEKRHEALRPIAIDAPGFQRTDVIRLPRPIDMLAGNGAIDEIRKLSVFYADTAILRFFELSYSSYPPSEILRSIAAPNAWGSRKEDESDVIEEYERFRWCVFGWCLQNWPRLTADSAREKFFEAIKSEVRSATPLVQQIFEGLSRCRRDEHTRRFIAFTITELAELERKNTRNHESPHALTLRVLLADALTIFALSIPPEELSNYEVFPKDGDAISFIDFLGKQASSMTSGNLSFLGSLHLKLTRPTRFPEPSWALHSIAETLLRGCDPNDSAGSHRLLRSLLYEINDGVATIETLRLLQANLSSFVAALDDLSRFSVERALPVAEIIELGDRILVWMVDHQISDEAEFPAEIAELIDELGEESEFRRQFDSLFHHSVESLRQTLETRAAQFSASLEFEYVVMEEVNDWCVLIDLSSITEPLTNWAIDAAGRKSGPHKSRIEVSRHESALGRNWLKFRIFTNFETLAKTNKSVLNGRNIDIEVRKLEKYGAQLPLKWQAPADLRIYNSEFPAVYEFYIPTGFIPKTNL